MIVDIIEFKKVFAELLKDSDLNFVFSTDIVMNSWIEWAVRNEGESGVCCLALERFMAWDDFKRSCFSSETSLKNPVPSVLRKIFVQSLIEKNRLACKNGSPLFKVIINPLYAQNSMNFTDWISKNLLSLDLWYKKFSALSSDGTVQPDEEDQDYLYLYQEYNKFLEKLNLFEQSWGQKKFDGQGKKFVIVFPEQFSDYEDYKELLDSLSDVTCLNLPAESAVHPEVNSYKDSRTEIRRTLLQISKMIYEDGISALDISLNVPELNILKPYLEMEFKKYQIPFVFRSGVTYTKLSAGSVFTEISDCAKSNFSYDSVRSLLLNGYIPWKNIDLNESLVREGRRLHCISNYEDEKGSHDPWIESLEKVPEDELEIRLYKKLKGSILKITSCSSFAELKQLWILFKNDFFSNEFSTEADNILSSCIKVLDELIDLENDFLKDSELVISDYYQFFLNEINSRQYNPRQSINGVSIFDYRPSAGSAFKYNFVINASQKNLSIMEKRLSFINSIKRSQLGLHDDDSLSSVYIRLYGNAVFSYSENSFSGFAIPHNYFVQNPDWEKLSSPNSELDLQDYYIAEEDVFTGNGENPVFSENQKNQFELWKERFRMDLADSSSYENITQFVEDMKKKEGALFVNQSDMSVFFDCPRKWLLKNVLRMREDNLDVKLFTKYDMGNIYHKIMEMFLKFYKENSMSLPACIEGSFGDDEEQVYKLVSECTEKALFDPFMDFSKSSTALFVFENQKQAIFKNVISLLKRFCDSDKGCAGFKVFDVEMKLSSAVNDEGVMLEGRIDAVLSDFDGNIYIIDFKSSNAPAIKDCNVDVEGVLNDFQIASYVLLWNKTQKVPVYHAEFFVITADKNAVIIDGSGKKSIDAFEPTILAFTEYINAYSADVVSANYEPSSSRKEKFHFVDKFSDCSSCKFNSVCRTTYSIAQRKFGE